MRLFLKQYAPLIRYFIVLQCTMSLLFYVDNGLQMASLFYFYTITCGSFLLFLLIRFIKEQTIFTSYDTEAKNYVEAVHTSYEEAVNRLKIEVQKERQTTLEIQDDIVAWVHEAKAPLTTLQLLIEKESDFYLKQQLEAEWLRLYLLLDSKLHATRLLTIAEDNRMAVFDVRTVVIEEVKALRSWCFEKQLAIEIDEFQKEVTSDRKWVGFIIRQILTNALKYSHIGGEVSIYAKEYPDAFELCIEDTGIGIRTEDLPRVFRKSYTGNVGRETASATGMGLYLAKNAADSLNMTLTISSVESKGTVVHILFPKENAYVKTFGM